MAVLPAQCLSSHQSSPRYWLGGGGGVFLGGLINEVINCALLAEADKAASGLVAK